MTDIKSFQTVSGLVPGKGLKSRTRYRVGTNFYNSITDVKTRSEGTIIFPLVQNKHIKFLIFSTII